MAIDNKDKKVLKSSIEREQNEVACSAECEKIKGSKNLNVPPLRFPEFSGEWKCTTIGNIGDIKNGPFGSVLHAEDYVENGIPIVTTEHFKTGLMPSDKFGIPQVSNEDYIRLKGYRLETNDIVFSRVGSVDINAHVGIEQNGWLFSGRVLRVRPKYDIDSLFLHYALSTEAVKRDIRNRAVGQTMPSINTPILSSTTIQLPKDLFEQKKVAHFLRLLDERIITQNKIIEKLQSLIKGLSQQLLSSENDWILYRLDDLAQIKSGYSGTQVSYQTPYKVSRIETISKHCIDIQRIGYVECIPESYRLNVGNILFSNINSIQYIGNTAYLDKDYGLYHGMNLLRIIPNTTIVRPRFLHLLLCTDWAINHFQTICNKAVSQASINQTALGKSRFPIPPMSVQQQICSMFELTERKLDNEQEYISCLQQQKRYLLQKMFI